MGPGQTIQTTGRDVPRPRTPDAPGALGDIGGDVSLHGLDVAEQKQITALADALSDEPIDILIHNAGINPGRGAGDAETTARTMRINAEAPIADSKVVFLNRLSDLFFLYARRANLAAGVADHEWLPPK